MGQSPANYKKVQAMNFFDVYICYDRRDFILAKRIASELEANRMTCWNDYDRIPSGCSFRDTINSAVHYVADNSKVMLCLISPETRMEGYHVTEVLEAVQSGAKFILPVYVDHARATGVLDNVLSQIQGIYIDSNNLDFTRLVDVVMNVLGMNAWIFISHSNKDFQSIVRLRNKLESRGYKPLLFFLKCLDDDVEIFELIKREIQARDRFILCDSQNSRESQWVQREIEYIRSLNRPYEIVDIDAPDSEIDAALDRYDRRTTVFIWSTETSFNQQVAMELAKKSFRVSLLSIDFFQSDTSVNHITEGYVLLLISRPLSEKEKDAISTRATQINDYIYPVVLSEEGYANGDLFYELQNGNGIHTKAYLLEIGTNPDCGSKTNDATKFFPSNAARAHSIVEDFIRLDSYVKNKKA